MRVFANQNLQILTEIAGSTTEMGELSIPRASAVPLEVQFTEDGVVVDIDPTVVTVADQTARYALRNAIQVALTSSSVANPTVITTGTAHGLVSGDTVTINNHTGSVPEIDGDHVVTVLSSTTFSIPVVVTTGGTGGTVARAADLVEGEHARQTDNGYRYQLVDSAEIDNASGWQENNLTIKWIVKKMLKFDDTPLALCNSFTKTGSGETAKYIGYVNYVTEALNGLLYINPPATGDDVEEYQAMAQLKWSGAATGQTDWITNTIRNNLDRDTDLTPLPLPREVIDGGTFYDDPELEGISIIKLRRANRANWETSTLILETGELGIEMDKGVIRVGNGSSNFVDLPGLTLVPDSSPKFVLPPASKTDMTVLPGGVAPAADRNYIAVGPTGIWTIRNPETEWRFTDRSSI